MKELRRSLKENILEAETLMEQNQEQIWTLSPNTIQSDKELIPTQTGKEQKEIPKQILKEKSKITEPYFASYEVVQFRNEYLKNIDINTKLGQEPLRLYFKMNNKPNSGFGSSLNIMLNQFHCAAEFGRQFQLIFEDWPFGDWLDYFDNVVKPSDGNLSQALVLTKEFAPLLARKKHNIQAEFTLAAKGDIKNREASIFTELIDGGGWEDIHSYMTQYLNNNKQRHEIIEARRILLQSIWQPKKEILDQLKKIMGRIVNVDRQTTENYLGINIRRGDKLSSSESDATPMAKYAEKVVLLLTQTLPKIESFVVTTDDASAVDEFIGEFNKIWNGSPIGFQSFDALTNSKIKAYPKGFVMKDFLMKNKTERKQHTIYFILQLMVMARSKQLVCTYSSNVCRIILLLRDSKSPYNSVHSVDWPHWIPD